LNSRTRFSEDTTPPRLLEESPGFKPSRTILETTSQVSDHGQWTQKIFFIMENPFNTVSRPRLTQLLSTPVAHSWLCLQNNTTSCKINGEMILKIWIANLMLLSARVLRAVPKSLSK
jgi:hypothetical protein